MSVVKGMVGRTKKKSPTDVVRHLRETLTVIEKQNSSDKNSARITEDFCKRLTQMKRILFGEGEHDPNPEAAVQLQNELLQHAMISRLISDMSLFEFESRKDVASIINNLLHRESGGRNSTAEHIAEHPEIIELLFLGYENPEIALVYGSILRECLKHQQLAKILLYSSSFYKFFQFVEVSNFDIASDAFSTFKDLLSLHREVSAEVLENNFDQVFTAYKELLSSGNYVTRRLSVKLLGELLLDRTHFNIMTRYISDPRNLKLMMTLLRDKSKSIQFEAFHVFKVFVANPNKPEPIMDILLTNQSRLISFLTNFQTDKEADDEQFRDEKAFLIKQIEQLKK